MSTGNPFGSILIGYKDRIRNYPQISVWVAALFLSSLWTFAWLLVFFITTWKFNLTTKPIDFICIFWLSIAAEALIRWAENTNFIASLAKPHEEDARGDNQDFRFPRASLLFVVLVLAMYMLSDFFYFAGLDETPFAFSGQGNERSINAIKGMMWDWWETATQANVFTPVLVGTLLRAIIYKRVPNNKDAE